MRFKRSVLIIFLVISLLYPAAAQAQSQDPVFVIRGHGWGHAVGMCQYGARGMAQAGKNYKEILTTYFQGTQVKSYNEEKIDIRVHISNQQTFTLTATSDFTLINKATGGEIGRYSAGEQVSLSLVKTKTGDILVSVSFNGSAVGAYTGPVELVPQTDSAEVRWGSKGYYGRFRVVATENNLMLINVVDLEKYVYGIGEMPSSWPAEALKAQAVAARTYGYYKIKHPREEYFDLYSSTSDQVYVGTSKINDYMGSAWKAACDATSKQLVFYGSSPAQVYYHSTCGGHTENVEDVWSSPLPYLKGVACSYCSDSPYFEWEARYTLSELREKLGRSSLAYVLVESRIKGRRVDKVRLIMNDGSSELMSASDFRKKLGYDRLKSTWFYIGGTMPRVRGQDRFETSVELSKKAFADASAVDTVVLASGLNFPDALAAAPLAGAVSGPLLLTHRDFLPSSVKNELVRLNPSTVYVVGGPSVISTNVVSQIKQTLPGVDVERLYGKDRFKTDLAIAARICSFTTPTTVFVVNGLNFPDALAVSGLAYFLKVPVILTDGESIDASLTAFLHQLPLKKIVVIGGPAAVSSSLKEFIQAEFSNAVVDRWWGKNRYLTAVEVQKKAVSRYGFSDASLKIVTGDNYPDALAAAPYNGTTKSQVILVKPDRLPDDVRSYIEELKNTCQPQFEIIGGENAVGCEVEFQLYGF